MSLSAIILAAGEGTRMKSAMPKVMHKLANKPMIGHVLATVKDLKLNQTIVVVGPNMEDLVKHVHYECGEAHCVIQHTRQGSADAVKFGLEAVANKDDDILVLYGDHPLITSATIEKMQKRLLAKDNNALVLISFLAVNPAQYGRIIDQGEGELSEIVEYNDCSAQQKEINLCNSGIMLIRGKLIRELISKIDNNNNKGEYYLTDLVAIACEEGWMCSHITIDESEVMGINSREELVEAEKIIQHNLRKKALANGVTLVAPETVHFSIDTEIERDVVISPYVVFGKGVVLKSGAEIRSFSHIEGATIGSNVKIGPYARIRPGTEIEENAAIGNFVEVKNSKIASGAKIGHLSYIGDAKIGQKVNIGAGTITCNYDGVNKHHTEIKSGAFIGSNTALVAPVTIGEDVIVAAGSVITKNVDDDSLAIARSEQKNLSGKAKSIRQKFNKRLDPAM